MKHGNKTNLGFLLNKSASLWDAELMRQFRKFGISDMKPSFGAVFIPLFDADGISAKDISVFSRLTKQTLSTYINQLEKLGYICRENNESDARFENIFLTAKGRKLQVIANKVVKNVNALFRSKISKSETESLTQILLKLIS